MTWIFVGAVAAMAILADGPVPDSAPAAAASDLIEHPRWVRLPTGGDFADTYPQPEFSMGIDGHVTLLCQVSPEGRMVNCAVTEETPQGHRFGKAGIALSRKFVMALKTEDGQPSQGRHVEIRLKWTAHGKRPTSH